MSELTETIRIDCKHCDKIHLIKVTMWDHECNGYIHTPDLIKKDGSHTSKHYFELKDLTVLRINCRYCKQFHSIECERQNEKCRGYVFKRGPHLRKHGVFPHGNQYGPNVVEASE